ncbi:hypothetical protein M231_01650 [Tremella mesenterica]|uniref:Uncharacterized protein n=1 Tax=Tremella mesenterica TaxID=5217 RepID=A0A4Q1BSL4_TREME|nr:hypothetical protein M231_01650 [Tremella mesenterica]
MASTRHRAFIVPGTNPSVLSQAALQIFKKYRKEHSDYDAATVIVTLVWDDADEDFKVAIEAGATCRTKELSQAYQNSLQEWFAANPTIQRRDPVAVKDLKWASETAEQLSNNILWKGLHIIVPPIASTENQIEIVREIMEKSRYTKSFTSQPDLMSQSMSDSHKPQSDMPQFTTSVNLPAPIDNTAALDQALADYSAHFPEGFPLKRLITSVAWDVITRSWKVHMTFCLNPFTDVALLNAKYGIVVAEIEQSSVTNLRDPWAVHKVARDAKTKALEGWDGYDIEVLPLDPFSMASLPRVKTRR